MFMLSGCHEKKSARRQPGDRRLTGLGFAECTRSGNWAPSRTKNTCREGLSNPCTTAESPLLCYEHSSHYVCSCLMIDGALGMLQRCLCPE